MYMGPLLRYPLIAFSVAMSLGFMSVVGKEVQTPGDQCTFFTDHFIELR